MRTERELTIEPEAESERIVTFISHTVKELGKKGAVLGLSGGLDSAVVAHLCVRALTPSRVHGLILPERDSAPQSLEDARRVAKELGIKSEEIELTPALSALGAYRPIPRFAARPWLVRRVYKRFKRKAGVSYLIHSLGPPAERPEFSFASFALPKLRMRMITLYQYASRLGYAVAGTTNRTEWEVGHYDRYGDGACDIDSIRHLYKTQVRELARYLGVPAAIIEKPPSPDLIPGITDELALGLSYAELDPILSLLDQGGTDEEVVKIVGVERVAVVEVRRAVEEARKMRRLPLGLDKRG
ncbi:TPA: NAD(+) synthetase [Candidatus Acetothermia bacterium]|nr:NAD(+) synthetase [Candidatus Acetothermia bacterium]